MALKIMLLATDEQDAPRAIGPVSSYEAADRLADEIEAAGWIYLCRSLVTSVSRFRAETREN